MFQSSPLVLLVLLASACGLWIEDAALPVAGGDSGVVDDTDTDTASSACIYGDVELSVGEPGDVVWAGQRIHLRFDVPVPASQVSVSVVARDAASTELAVGPFSSILAADQVQIYEPPSEGWIPDTAHDLTVTYGENCSVSTSFNVGTLGFPASWSNFGRLKVVADLSKATVFPLGLGLPNDTFQSHVLVDFQDSWEDGSPPAGGVVAGALEEERASCSDALYGQATQAPGPGSLRVSYSKISVVLNGEQVPSLDGEVAIALDTNRMEMPQMSLWVKTELLEIPDVCDHTACRVCTASGATCALVLLEGVPLQRTNTELNGSAFNCFPGGEEHCSHFCPI